MNFRNLVLTFSIVSIAFFSCDNTPKNQELENYVFNVIPDLMKEELALVKEFNQISPNDMLKNKNGDSIISNIIIPNYKKFIGKLDTVTIKDPELKKIHAKYIEASYLQLDYYDYFLANLRNNFSKPVDSLNTKTDLQRAVNKEWGKLLNDMCQKYGVDYLQE